MPVMAVGIGPLSNSVRRGSLCNRRAIPLFASDPFRISFCGISRFTRTGYDAAMWKGEFEPMHQRCDDILSRIAEPPRWFDEQGVPPLLLV
jgi:hypothetical protein